MRRSLAFVLALLCARVVLADEPAEIPTLLGDPQRPAPRLDLPEWMAEITGLDRAPRPSTVTSGRLRWAAVPFVVSNPLIGLGAGAAVAGAFRLGDAGSTSYSSFSVSGLLTTNGQRSLNVRSKVRLPDNDWLLVGDWALSHFPGPAWGVGPDTPDSAQSMVDRREVKFHETAYRRVNGPVYVGLGYFLDDEFDIEDRTAAATGQPTAFTTYPYGTSGRSLSSGATVDLLVEERDNPVNPWRGVFALARLRIEPPHAGTPESWQSLWLEGRGYVPLGHAQTLALWAYGWTSFGNVPWFSLPAVGRDPDHRSGRGWIEGRHVGRDLLGAEAEWRTVVWEFVGAVAGVNVHAVSDRDSDDHLPSFPVWHPGVVGGLRITLDRRSLTCIAVDGAWRPGGFTGYLAFNEAF